MPELDKDIILDQDTEFLKNSTDFHQNYNEEVLTLEENTSFDEFSNHKPDLIGSEIKSKSYHRPFTAPPDPIPRSALRTHSEPPLRLTYPSTHKSPQYDEKLETKYENNIIHHESIDENSKCDSPLKCNSSSDLSSEIKSINKSSDSITAESILETNNNNNTLSNTELLNNSSTTWHAHVYAKPPKTPTPHTIGDILGWTGCNKTQSHLTSQMTEIQEPSSASLNQLLNSNLKAAVSDNYHNNHHHHQSQFISRRCTSLSESSEDDSGICEQPLNLSITKSRDTSPALSIGKNCTSRVKKGECGSCLITIYSLFNFFYNILIRIYYKSC